MLDHPRKSQRQVGAAPSKPETKNLLERTGTSRTPIELNNWHRQYGNQAVGRMIRPHAPASNHIQRETGLNNIGAVSLDMAGGDIGKAKLLVPLLRRYSYGEVYDLYTRFPKAFLCPEQTEFVIESYKEAKLLANMLQLVHQLQLLRQAASFHEEQLTLLAGCSADLIADAGAFKSVVDAIVYAETIDIARARVKELQLFGYDPDLDKDASREAGKHVGNYEHETLEAIDRMEKQGQLKAVDLQVIDAETLKRIVKKNKTDKSQDDAKQQQKRKQAAPQIAEIAADSERKRKELSEILPNMLKDRKQEHSDYYRTAGYHPKAKSALQFCGYNFELALRIIQYCKASPENEKLLLGSKQDLSAAILCMDTFSAVQLGQVLGQITIKEFLAFAGRSHWLAMLQALFASGVAAGHLKVLALNVAKFELYSKNATAVGNLAALLAFYGVDDIIKLLNEAPPYGQVDIGKMALLEFLRPLAQTANDLLECLKLCRRANWGDARIRQAAANWAPNSTMADLTANIRSLMLGDYNMDSEFVSWLRALNVLAQDNYVTLTFSDPAPLGGQMYTNEVVVEVNRGTANLGEFVIHTHPQAGNAMVGNAYASKIHFKPDANSKTRISYEDAGTEAIKSKVPDSVKNNWLRKPD